MNPSPLETLAVAQGLAAALVVGLMIGFERGWRDRDVSEGGRVAGLRTFALTGVLGGVLGVLSQDIGAWPLAAGLLGLAALLAVSYRETVRLSSDRSATGAVAMLLTLALGALAARGAAALALACAVIVAVLLDLKPTLHRWLQLIEHRELSAALQLLVLSVVILPNLPDQGWGPYAALNPYQLWWGVVLIAALSLSGHALMRATGAQRGVFWSGVLGGLASSTAATLTLARLARQRPELAGAVAAGALAACGVMFFRMATIVVVIQPSLALSLGPPLLAMGAVLLIVGVMQWRRQVLPAPAGGVGSMPAFDLSTALAFGLFLAVMAVLVPAARHWLGEGGLYALAALSGLADVDAIVISVSRLYGAGGLNAATTALALGLAALSNMVTKVFIAWGTGGAAVGRPVLRGYLLATLIGAAVSAFTLLA